MKREKTTFTTASYRAGVVRKINHEINLSLDLRDFEGTPGFALLALAANRHLSIETLRLWLETQGAERGQGWIQKRRWLFQPPEMLRVSGARANADGKDGPALKIMAENPRLSLRDLSKLLAKRGITRSREWIRKHRCAGN